MSAQNCWTLFELSQQILQCSKMHYLRLYARERAEMQVECFSRLLSTLFIMYYYYLLLRLLLSLLRQMFPVNSKPTECVRCLSYNLQGGDFLLFAPTRLELDTHIHTWLLSKCSEIWTESIIVTTEALLCDNYIVPAIYYYKK